MTPKIPLFALICLLALCASAQLSDDLPADGILSPQESAAYIQGLASRALHDECVTQANIFLERYPQHPLTEAVETWRIQGLFALQKYPEAATAIQAHLKQFPNTANRALFLWDLGECLRNTGDYASALPAYEDMLKNAKGDQAEEAHYRLAICLDKLNRINEAKAHLQLLAELQPSAKHLSRIYARHYLAILLQKEGKAKDALDAYLALLELQGLPHQLRQTLLRDAAYIAFTPPIQNYQLAEQFYGTFVAEFPKETQSVLKNLLSCHYALGHFQEYLECYRQHCQQNSELQKDAELHWLAIRSLAAVKRFSEALPQLKTLLQDETLPEPRRQNATLLAIQCLEALKADQELVDAAKKYCQDYPNALDANDIMRRAIYAEERLGKTTDAIADIQALMPKLAAGSPILYQQMGLKLATLLNQTSEFKRSADTFLELAEKAPETSEDKQYLTQRQLKLKALTPLAQLPDDHRGLPLAMHLSDSATDQEERLRLLNMRFQFALREGKANQALETVAIVLPLVTPLQQVDWLQRRAQVHTQLQQFNEVADDYIEVLKNPECPVNTRVDVLPTLLTILYHTHRNAEAPLFLPELFDLTPPPQLSKKLLYKIALDRSNAGDYTNARKAYQRILDSTDLTDITRDAITIQLAQVEFLDKQLDKAIELISNNATARETRGLEQSSDAIALRAEITLQQGDYNNAFIYAKQVLTNKDKTALTETIPRARWIQAKALLERGDYNAAFTAATQGFILSKHPLYSPLSYLVAIQAKEKLGDKTKAEELKNALKTEYPNFIMP